MKQRLINLNAILVISILLLWSQVIQADSVIRDSEIESVIAESVGPIIKAANIGNIKIILIQNNEINAYTAGGNEIFVNTGLIALFPDADVFKGVIAHEIGHMMGHHMNRFTENVAQQSKIAMASVAVGIVSTIASNNPNMLIAGVLAGGDIAEKSILKYSRTYESSADQAAFKLLEKSGNSVVGMKNFFEHFLSENRSSNVNKYLLTHPVTQERLETVKLFLTRSDYEVSTTPLDLQKRFARAAYKIFAFTVSDPKELLKKLPFIREREIALYVKAICNMRLSEYNKSIEAIDRLIYMYPKDPYYYELKGQIFFEFGKKEALPYFEKAVSMLPNDVLMKMNTAIVALNVYRDTYPNKLEQFIPYIKLLQQKEPNSLTPYYYLSLYYAALNNDIFSKLYLAIYYDKLDNPQAKILAKSVLQSLTPETPEWYWAKDIIDKESE